MTREIDAKVAEAMGWAWYQHALQQTEARGYVGDNPRFLLSPEYVATFDTQRAYFNTLFKKAASDAPFFGDYGNVPHYTTDIAAAWKVVEWMREYSGFVVIHGYATEPEDRGWFVAYGDEDYGATDAPTAPLAICLAFLRAMGAEVEDEV